MGPIGILFVIGFFTMCITRCTLFTLGALFVGFKHFKKCAAAEGWEGKTKQEKKQICKKIFNNFLTSNPSLRTFYNTTLDPLLPSNTSHTTRELPNNTYLIEVDVAGIRREDLIISVQDAERALLVKGKTVSGETDVSGKEVEREVDTKVELPGDADLEGLRASVVNGVLRVEAVKKSCEGRRIYVE
ncbi:hypothetical protein HK097_008778 [Rhizophlyctis rosea]|uniref:SHSP domain-containing protein n=1 Tax=Rhizophlyctis rosea TaxID=64517 RepID=A0AAD5X524_9FUNG|nr:hypothetical protein HK097_008778 [Rhizophlyctis rosea]